MNTEKKMKSFTISRIVQNNNSNNFTIVELLVVIAVIAILTSLLFPALKQAKKASNGIICRNNLKQIGTASMNYAIDWNGILPHNGAPEDPDAWHELSSTHWPYKLTDYGIYKPDVWRGTAAHCPECVSQVQPRWLWRLRGDIDYTINYYIGMKHKLVTGWINIGPYQKNLTSSLFWYCDASFTFYGGDQKWHTGLWAALSSFENMPWMFDTSLPFIGKGHTGNTANLVFGDCHVESLARQELINRTTPGNAFTSGSNYVKFNGGMTRAN